MSNGAMSDWTPEMIAVVERYWGAAPAREIGDMIGKSKNAVIGKAWRLELQRFETPWATHQATAERISTVYARMVEAA